MLCRKQKFVSRTRVNTFVAFGYKIYVKIATMLSIFCNIHNITAILEVMEKNTEKKFRLLLKCDLCVENVKKY